MSSLERTTTHSPNDSSSEDKQDETKKNEESKGNNEQSLGTRPSSVPTAAAAAAAAAGISMTPEKDDEAAVIKVAANTCCSSSENEDCQTTTPVSQGQQQPPQMTDDDNDVDVDEEEDECVLYNSEFIMSDEELGGDEFLEVGADEYDVDVEEQQKIAVMNQKAQIMNQEAEEIIQIVSQEELLHKKKEEEEEKEEEEGFADDEGGGGANKAELAAVSQENASQLPPSSSASSAPQQQSRSQQLQQQQIIQTSSSSDDQAVTAAIMVEDKPWRKRHSATRPLMRYIRSWGSAGATTGSTGGSANNSSHAVEASAISTEVLPTFSRSGELAADNNNNANIQSGGYDTSDEVSVESIEEEEAEESGGDSWLDDDYVDDDEDDEEIMERPYYYLEEAETIDWEAMPVLPHRFCLTDHGTIGNNNAAPPYLDSIMMHPSNYLTEREANSFAREQGLLLRAVLQLLAERDQVGVEGSIHSRDNIWKKGPLKKLSIAGGRRKRPGSTKWKVKYVELRQGNLCYYEDSGHGRKTIHLRQADTVVQQASQGNWNYPGLVFELSAQGSPVRFWMASSEEECQAWIRAIRSAMIGDEGPQRELDLTPHQESLEIYTNMRYKLGHADTKELYLEAIQSAIEEEDILQIPVQWVRDQMKHQQKETSDNRNLRNASKMNLAPHKQLKSSITEFWRNMGQTMFSINGIPVPREAPMASECVVGALTRCILEYDRASLANAEESSQSSGAMTELQAVSYARNILQTVLRSKEQQDASCVVQHLLSNLDLVVLSSPKEEEYMVNIDVSFAGEELPNDLPPIAEEKSGWLWVRRYKQAIKGIKKRYVVLSGAVFSYYEAATPRPSGLRAQLVLRGATLQEHEAPEGEGYFVLSITTAGQKRERFLTFDEESEFIEWKEAIQASIDSCETATEQDSTIMRDVSGDEDNGVMSATPLSTKLIRKSAERVIKGADDSIRGGIRVIKRAQDGSRKAIKTATDGSMKVLRGAVGRLRPSRSAGSDGGDGSSLSRSASIKRRPSMQMLLNSAVLSGKREPTVQCVVQATQTFCVSARNDLDNEEELWLTVSANLYRAFLLIGGPSGRMAKGDALIQLDFVDTTATNNSGEGVDESAEVYEELYFL